MAASNHVGSAVRIWNVVKGLSTADLARRIALPVSVTITGDPAVAQTLTARLMRETPAAPPTDGGSVLRATRAVAGPNTMPARGDEIVFHAARIITEEDLLAEIDRIAIKHRPLRIALAAAIPAFRPVVADQLSREYSLRNAKIAALSALPGIVPLTDWAMPITAVGDIFVLTRNQMALFLEIAACYGLPPDLQSRVREFAVVVGGAFFWRAAARQLVGMVPGGVGVAVKATIAYAGTYAVGKAGAAYISRGGHRIGPRELGTILRNGVRRAPLALRSPSVP